MKRILLITEKNHHSKIVVTALNGAGIIDSNTLIDFVHTWGTSWWHYPIPSHIPRASIPFTYGRNISFSKLKPRPRTEAYWDRLAQFDRSLSNGLMRKSDADEEACSNPMAIFAQRWNEYDEIIVCPNNSPNGWGAAMQFLRMAGSATKDLSLPFGEFLKGPVRLLIIEHGIQHDSVVKAYQANSDINDPKINECSSYYDTKTTFDYYWNCNSAALFTECQQLAGIDRPQIISKYMLMTLHILQAYQRRGMGGTDPLSTIQVTSGLMGWVGTGKYAIHNQYASPSPLATLYYNPIKNSPNDSERPMSYYQKGIGSPMSVSKILENLCDLGLITIKNDLVEVSDKGQVFLSFCHPTTFDPDLPFRLDVWCRAGSYAKIDTYIKTVFGRQKRYLSKLSSINKVI